MTVIELKNRLNKLIESGYEDWEVVGIEEWFDGGYEVHFSDEPEKLDSYNKQVELDIKVFE